MKEIPFGTIVPGKKNAVFVAITALSAIYANYDDKGMSDAYKATKWPMTLMVQRWDSRVGFVGGFVEEGHSLIETANHELEEEIGITNVDPKLMVGVCAHEGDDLVAHLYHYHLGDVDWGVLRYILDGTTYATHCIAEVCAFWAHLGDYGKGKGRETLLNANTLAFGVKEELEKVLARLDAKTPTPVGT